MKLKNVGTVALFCFANSIGLLVLYAAVKTNNIQMPEMTVRCISNNEAKLATNTLKHIERPYNIYIMNGYLIKDNEIRITLLNRCDYLANLTLLTDRDDANRMSFPVTLESIENCPIWLHRCVYHGMYGNVKIRESMDLESYIEGKKHFYLAYEDDLGTTKPIRLRDSRVHEGKKKEHRLGVCLFPIVLMPEWSMLAQFFEQWIEHGATKFYFPYQSITKDFDSMLRIYERDPSISIERIDWSLLPARKGTRPDDDPNNLVFRAEEVFAVNDCRLRAQGHVDYLAIMDFDETIVIYKNSTLLQLFDELYAADNTTAAFLYRSTYAQFENCWVNANNPKQLDFDMLKNVSVKFSGALGKIIVKPERVRAHFVHYVLRMEDNQYKTYNMDPNITEFYHLRLVPDKNFKANDSSPSSVMSKYVPKWTERYKQRIATEEKRLETAESSGYLTLKDQNWATRGNAIMHELEECFWRLYGDSGQHCPAHIKCTGNLTTIRPEEWMYVNQSWVVL